VLHVDGTPSDHETGTAGIGIVVRALDGRVLRWHSLCVPARTCNEAEYRAVIAGVQFVRRQYPSIAVVCLSDSRIVVDQIAGRAAVRAAALVPLHQQLLTLIRQGPPVRLIAIGRDLNRLADALAWEARAGQAQLRRVIAATHEHHRS
jgi:ribonuclease HI